MSNDTYVGGDLLAAVKRRARPVNAWGSDATRVAELVELRNAVEDARYELDDLDDELVEMLRELGVETRRCRGCGHVFAYQRDSARTCSTACRVAVNRLT